MKLEVLRFNSSDDFTTGLLFDVTDNVRSFLCYTLEDEARTVKQWGETRIPAATYNLSLRTEGGFHSRYLTKFGAEFHKGMLWVQPDPKGFEYILWHIGNDDDDTAGCLLVGKTSQDNFIGNSTTAYKEIYPPIRDAILSGEEVTVTYRNFDGSMDSEKLNKINNTSNISKDQEGIMDILSTEIKHLKAEVKALRQAIILKGMQVK